MRLINVQDIKEVAMAAGIGVAGMILTNFGLLSVLLTCIKHKADATHALFGTNRSDSESGIQNFCVVALELNR